MADFKLEWVKNRNTRLVEGKSLVFHCHHYNCHLQKTIDDSKMVDGKGIQINAAREVAHEHFIKAFAKHPELKTPEEKFRFASEFFKTAGFGLIDFREVTEKGGTVKTPVSHYAKGWMAKWGKRDKPMCYFNSGWISGVVAAIFEKQRYYYDVEEIQCESVEGTGCTYIVEVR